MREIKFRVWNNKLKEFAPDDCNICLQGDDKHVSFDYFNGNFDTIVWDFKDLTLMQFTVLKDKDGVDIYENDFINICYESECGYIFDGIYRVDITFSGISFKFIRLMWEDHAHNQEPYEKAHVGDYGFITTDYKNQNSDFRLCVSGNSKFKYSNYFKVIGNIHENPELIEA